MNLLADLYGNNDKFRKCPSAMSKNEFGLAHPDEDVFGSTTRVWECGLTADTTDKFARYEGSYGINSWINQVPDAGPFAGGWRGKPQCQWDTNNQKNASNIPILGDCIWYGGNPETQLYSAGGKIPLTPDWLYDKQQTADFAGIGYYDIARFCIARHNRGMNMAFMDGSVRQLPLPELWQLKWHRESQPPGPGQVIKIPWLN
jgi:prepilin-type processing-associated H-X9-DG protein